MDTQECADKINDKYDILMSLPWKAVQTAESCTHCWMIVDKDGKMVADGMSGPVAEYIVTMMTYSTL